MGATTRIRGKLNAVVEWDPYFTFMWHKNNFALLDTLLLGLPNHRFSVPILTESTKVSFIPSF